MNKKTLDAQQQHWENTFKHKPDMFGTEPSYPAQKAGEMFKAEGCTDILELGCGQGRDTLYFARRGFNVYALDYSATGLATLTKKAAESGLAKGITTTAHDVRNPLPFVDGFFYACYSHMLFCMALTTSELQAVFGEVRRVLKPGGLHMYTVRHTGDVNYRHGIRRGEDMYEIGGFIVHFFTRQKVELLGRGWQTIGVEEFEEGPLPRKLFRVTLRKEKGPFLTPS